MENATHVVVVAGGSGTRLWPLSRQQRPKQLLALDGHEPLLATTFSRVATLAPPERWWIVTAERYRAACHQVVPAVAGERLLVEPVARNTTAAIGLAAVHVGTSDPHAVMAVLPADHFVAEPEALCRALEVAVRAARHGSIVALGIAPTRPETGYGYIERGLADARTPGAFRIERFCEKPSLNRAREFVARGGYDWNAGIFVAEPKAVLAEIARQLPRLHAALMRIERAIGQADYPAVLEAAFNDMPSVSFDYGVMEGARDLCVVPCACGWSDVGALSALGAVIAPNAAGNIAMGRVVEIDSHDCVLHADRDHLLAVVGISGLAVVHTTDATLVVPLERAQEVQSVLGRLGELGWNEYL